MKTLCAGLLIGAASTLAAPAFIYIEATFQRITDHFGFSGEQALAQIHVSADDPGIVSARVSSPSGSITGEFGSSTSNNFGSFEDLRSEVHSGSWTLTVGREAALSDPVLTEYTFEMDISGLNAPESFSILSPANGSTGVPAGQTLFQWNPPTDVFSSQALDLFDVTGSLYKNSPASIEIGPGDSSFDTGVPGLQQSRRYLFYVVYSKDATLEPGVSISMPVDGLSNPLGDFGYSIRLNNEAETVFMTVPEPGAWALIAGIGLGSLALVRRGRGRGASLQ